MPMLDVFNNNAFSMVEMTTAINQQPFLPTFLGDLKLFNERPIRTTDAAVEERNGTLTLVQTSVRGAPPAEGKADKRGLRFFPTVRLAKGSTITSSEVQNVREMGRESDLQVAINVIGERVKKLQDEMALTHENMRLGAVQGIVYDADGSVLYNWFNEWNVTPPTELNWNLDATDPTPGAIRQQCNVTTRAVMRVLGSMWLPGQSYLMGLCGDNFYDALTQHSEVRETYRGTDQAPALRDGNLAFEAIQYGGIVWVNYRGTDDAATVAVHPDKVKFVPVACNGLFEVAWAPSESVFYANTPGQSLYALLLIDGERNAWVRPELYSYPLFYCTRPAALLRGRWRD